MSRIYWDSMVFSYLLEENPIFGVAVRTVQRRMVERGDTLCASVLSMCELMVLPVREGNAEAAERIRRFFHSGIVDLLPLSLDVPPRFAELRARGAITTPDALHLAIAATAGVDVFLTNDKRLRPLHIAGIQFIATLDSDFL